MKNILTLSLLLISLTLFSSPKEDLFKAIFKGDLCTVERIVQSKRQANWKNNDGIPILYFAAAAKQNDIAQYLVASGANILWENKNKTMLHAACEGSMSWLVKSILAQSSDLVNRHDHFNRSPIELASASGCDTAVMQLLQNGATNIDEALYKALYNEFFTTAQLLVNNGANIHSIGGGESDALYFAMQRNSIGMAKFLMANGADINAPLKSSEGVGEPLLYRCIYSQRIAFVNFCLLNGADFSNPIKIKEGINSTNTWTVLTFILHTASRTYRDDAGKWISAANLILDKAVQEKTFDSVFANAKYVLDIAIKNKFKSFLYNVLYYDETKCINVVSESGDTISATHYIAQSDLSSLLDKMENIKTPEDHLFDAIVMQDLKKVKSLIKDGVNFGSARTNMMIAGEETEKVDLMDCAINTGNRKIANYLLSLDDYYGVDNSAYRIAAKNNDVEMFKFLITKDDRFDSNKKWILYHIMGESPVFTEIMLKHGVNADEYIFNGQSFLFYAIRKGNAESVNHFLDYSEKIEPQYKQLFKAIEQSNAERIKTLIAKGVDINKTISGGLTPLCWAAYLGKYDMAKLLIENKADVNIKMSDEYDDYPIYGSSPTRWAVEKQQVDILKLLIDSGATPDAFLFLNESVTILHLAVKIANLDIVKLLLKTNIELNDVVVWNNGLVGSPFDQAAYYGNTAICKLFIDKGFDADNKEVAKFTPLLNAVSEKRFETSQFLIQNGADVNFPLPFESILAEALRLSSPEIIELLFNNGMVLIDTSESLRYAIEYQDTNMIKMIINKGADINITVPNTNPLIHTVSKNNPNRLANYEYLIRQGVDINTFNQGKRTILQEAVIDNDIELIQLLIKNGVNVNQATASRDKKKPIDLSKSFSAFKLLKSNGAKQYILLE